MSVYVSRELQRRVRSQFRDCCAYCRTAEHLSVVAFEIEHITPLSKSGQTEFANLCLACPTCNRFKAAREFATDPLSFKQVALFHPQRDDWDEHFEWSGDGS